MLAGCAAQHTADAAKGPTAECSVCRENGDLACLCVQVTDSTPRVEYGGKTYYFCSEECCKTFSQHPEKYAGR
jgi:YHS domain-containing protein